MEVVGKGPVAIDTPIFIYHLQDHPKYAPSIAPLFEAIRDGKLKAVTSGVTLLEALVLPLRMGDLAMADRFEAMLTKSRGLTLVELDHAVLRSAAQLRAMRSSLKSPDALHLAAALRARCSSFITNDRGLPQLAGVRIIVLDDVMREEA